MDASLLWESWTLIAILGAAFLIGWTAEAAQTFIPRALALSILAWLQTLPEFAVEASIAWNQDRGMMIANLTGSLRLLVGLGWPMIFFVHFFFQGVRKRRWIPEIHLEKGDYLSVLFLFISILYFILILLKRSLTCVDSVFLSAIYIVYLVVLMKLPAEQEEEITDLPYVSRQIVKLPFRPKVIATVLLFAIGGIILFFTVEPFIDTLKKWALLMGVSSFVVVQWLAPFLSEFPEKVTAFNWARQEKKAPMALMNMVNSNINQWTMLAAMIPLVFSLSIGDMTPVLFDDMHADELALTIAQSALGGLLLLDMRFSLWDALGIFILWLVQFVDASLRQEITLVYLVWIAFEVIKYSYLYFSTRQTPEAFVLLNGSSWVKKRRGEVKAAFLSSHGDADVIQFGEIPTPTVGPKSVRVRLRAASLNHLDLWVRRGLSNLKLSYPHVLGADGAGVIDAVGDQVQGWSVGQEVVIFPGISCDACEKCQTGWESLCPEYQILGEHCSGTYAESVVVSQNNVFNKPKNMNWEESAAFALTFITAWQMVRVRAQVKKGDWVLVHAAGSGVSHAAIQMCRLLGANVIATAGSAQKLELAKRLGASHAFDSQADGLMRSIREICPNGVDVIIDHVGEVLWEMNLKSLKWGGTLVTCGATSGYVAKTDLRQLFFRQLNLLGSTMGSKNDFPELLKMIESGQLKVNVDKVFQLNEASKAHSYLESRANFGKVILQIPR